MSSYNVLGLVIKVKHEHLKALRINETGGSSLLDQEQLEMLIDDVEELQKKESEKNPEHDTFKVTLVPGGSCANTIKGLACLGSKCALTGKIGKDAVGKFYKEGLSKVGVIPLMTESPTSRTGEVVCLITEDGQRTMRAFLGASDEMNENDLLMDDFKDVKLFHIEGYAIYNLPLMLEAVKLAKQNGALISYDLGSFELVRKFRSLLTNTILKEHVDIVFANEEEALQLGNLADAKECVDFLADLCQVAVVMMGPKGCWVKSNGFRYRCRTEPVTAIDTTGAGDCFASAFLYAYLQGYSLEQCARLGCLAGREVVQVVGANLSVGQWKKIKASVNNEKLLLSNSQQQFRHYNSFSRITPKSISQSLPKNIMFSGSFSPEPTMKYGTLGTSIPIAISKK